MSRHSSLSVLVLALLLGCAPKVSPASDVCISDGAKLDLDSSYISRHASEQERTECVRSLTVEAVTRPEYIFRATVNGQPRKVSESDRCFQLTEPGAYLDISLRADNEGRVTLLSRNLHRLEGYPIYGSALSCDEPDRDPSDPPLQLEFIPCTPTEETAKNVLPPDLFNRAILACVRPPPYPADRR